MATRITVLPENSRHSRTRKYCLPAQADNVCFVGYKIAIDCQDLK
jgi:hypothetical protein